MKSKKTRSSFINIGFSSIVMVFIMICLVTFATLSVLTAHSDYRLSQKMAQKTTAYYEADATARDMAAFIDKGLFHIYSDSSTASDYYQLVLDADFSDGAPASVTNITATVTNDIVTISYKVPVSEVQTLNVSLKINYPKAGSECFSTIAQWQTVTVNEPDESDEFLNLYTGEE